MMELLLTKSLSQLILPPGGLILLGLLGLLLHRHRFGRFLIACSLTLFWLLATAPVRDALLYPLEEAYEPLDISHISSTESSAIALLGGGVYEKAPEFGGRDSLSGSAMMRTTYAAELARKTGFDIYVSGGAVLSEDAEPEGVIMQHWLRRFGVEDDRIHVESFASTTWENAANIKEMLHEKQVSTLILVTTAWHMPRSVRVFKEQGINVVPAPCDYKRSRGSYDLRSFLPRWDVFADSCDGLHEYLGMLWYSLKRAV